MIWIYGIFTIISQAILLREVSTIFQNNEITVSLLLFYWLLGTGLGSYYFKRSKVGTPIAFLAANISFVASIFLVKIVFGYLQYRANPDIFSLFMLSAVFILPVSFCVGYCFSSFYSDMTKLWRLYAVESVAAFLGGLIFTFGIVGNLDPITVSLIFLSIALLLVRATRYVKLLYVAAALLVLILIPTIRGWAVSIQWRKNVNLISTQESRYANITLVENNGISSLYYNGKIISNYPAQALYEETVHVPLMARASDPKNILVVGYAPKQMLDELYRYKPISIDVVDQDKKLSPIAKDPLLWIKRTTCRFDVVLLNIPAPSTISDSRFFSDRFFSGVSLVLDEKGIFIVPVAYEENNPTPNTLKMLKIIYNTLKSSFKYVQMVPGTQFYFIASNEDAVIDTSKKLPSGIKFINKGYIDHYLNKDRLAEFKSLLDGIKIESINSLKSMRLFDLNLMKWVKNYSSFSLLLIFALFTFFSVKVWRMARSATINSRILFVCGLISIITEVALLTLFQISTGQIYYLYGLFAASFMLGLGFGSSFKRINPVYMAIWPAAVLVASMYIFIPSYMFIVLNFFGGLICGGIFYFLAVMEEKEPMNLYSFDLLGSAFGALIAGPLLLPVFGITVSLVIAILLAGITCRKYI